jgi:hypothetical protein
MVYTEIVAVCSEIHTQHINTPCGQKVELLNVKPSGTYSDHWALGVLNLSYKNQSVSAVQGNNRCLFSDPHKTRTYAVWDKSEFMSEQAVYRP